MEVIWGLDKNSGQPRRPKPPDHCSLQRHDLKRLRKNCSAAESLPQRLKAAKQSKVLTAALKRCATPKRNSMEFFRNL